MKIVRTEPILWFLQSNGWKEEKTNERYHIMQPPKELKFEPKARFYVPLKKFETNPGYHDSVSGVIESISFLYQIELLELQILFSKTKDELKKNFEYLRGMLAQVN